MKTNNRILLKMAALILTIVVPAAISAHDVWFEMKDFNHQKGAFVECSFPSDHAFPSTNKEFVPADRVAQSYLIPPTGVNIPIVSVGNNVYRSARKLMQPGSYLAVTGKKWTYWTQTTEGFQEGKSKLQTKGALKGIYSGKFCKAIVTVDKPGGNAFSRIVGHDLEIVPLKDPASLVKGDTLPIKVLFKGKPAEMEVRATYDGYSSKQNVFAVTIKTNLLGMGEIKIKNKGKWLMNTSFTEKSVDTRLYDEKMYAATLTFQIYQ